MMEIAKFNPAKEEIQAVVMEVEGLTIAGVDDVAGYEAVKAGKKKLAEYRIKITKFGKEQRDEAIKYQKGVIAAERELLDMITPTEDALKAKIEAVDAEKARAERMILLPSRKLMLDEIGAVMTDEEILDLDEKQFSELYTSKKMAFLENQEALRKEAELRKQHEEDVKRASEEAAKRATEEAERKAKEELARVEREKQAEIDRLNREEEARKKAEADKIAAEQADLERAEKNRRYKAWLKKNGVNEDNMSEFYIARQPQISTFVLYKKVDEITIK